MGARTLIALLILSASACGKGVTSAEPGTCAYTNSCSVKLAWDASATPGVDYRVHWGSTSGVYENSASAGTSTEFTVTGLGAGKFYFAVTAVDSVGWESPYSNEVMGTISTDGQMSKLMATSVALPN
jgi:hypothetical protein